MTLPEPAVCKGSTWAAAEAADAGAPVIIAPASRVIKQEGIDARGKSLGTVGTNLLKMQDRLGKLNHPLAQFLRSPGSAAFAGPG